jgi:hypothetical protein
MFTHTKGGTELGVSFNPATVDTSNADFVNRRGRVRFVGDLILDFQPLSCVADIEIESLRGEGRLQAR